MTSERFSDLPRTLLQVLLLCGLIAGAFWVVRPFLAAGSWAAMMVVATWPLLLRVQSLLGGRRSLAVMVMTIALLLVLILPLYTGAAAIVNNVDSISALSKSVVEFASAPPPSWVEDVPLVGAKIATRWREYAAAGPEAISDQITPHIRDISAWLLSEVGSLGAVLIQFLLTVAIAAVLYWNGEAAAAKLTRFAERISGAQGESTVRLAGQAIQAVALGIVVTAMVQSGLAGIGLAIAGVPLPGVLTAVIFVLCVAQLGPGLILLPAIGWMYWQGQTGWATALLVWAVPVIALDGFLRPILIKRSIDLPMLLILPGVIGGLIAYGIIGLFIGPVLLAVGYTLLEAWVAEGEADA